MYRLSGFQFYNTSEFDLAELVNDSEHLAANFKAYIQGFSANIQDIIRSLDFDKQIDKMDKNNRLLSVVKAFSDEKICIALDCSVDDILEFIPESQQ